MDNNSHDPMDALLDSALSSYSNAEPLNGLEDRILNRASRTQPRPNFGHGTKSLLAVGASLALLCLIIFTFEHRKSEPTSRPALTASHVDVHSPAQISSVQPLPSPSRRRLDRHHPRLIQRLPKREQFPTPEPLTRDERALLSFVQQDPKEAVAAFSAMQRQTDTPLEIQPLKIEPL
ncbi:MAG: hypothetical protein WA324_30525 [Bryobacteraceae bacterium]